MLQRNAWPRRWKAAASAPLLYSDANSGAPRRGHHYIVPHQTLVEVRVQLDATGERRRLTSEDTTRKDHSAWAHEGERRQATSYRCDSRIRN